MPPRQGAPRSRSGSRVARSKSKSPASRRGASQGQSKSPQRRLQDAANAKAKLAAEMAGITTPPKPSASPKRGARRGRTPPRRRESTAEESAQQPFQPSPLTPVGWDVDSAKAAGTIHPSAKKGAAPQSAREASHSPDNPNRVARLELKREKKQRWRLPQKILGGGRGRGGRGRGNAKGGGQAKGAARGQQKGQKPQQPRVVKFTIPGKDAAGGGKGRGK